ncbi:putative 2-oxoglutarate (2OG) and Fe(II)-dependent oxygenase superfamily protein [Hibiscus syriacus]|uniref:2-oxoglutarate (2OG) and Fe(II)-dependent oxygenase superfamily protein n=1 Tax=Hibiscus syriacus TaxID=106335 RepID=A0A6A2XIT7_HIBSY|nr:putative 2-oxoglutarate (2OG) and Fe(II)-dependent oxygenase superfamily protein [Hibiscus syriacus]
MVVTNKTKVNEDSNYDRQKELKASVDSKDGVKGLVDAEITKVPRMFIAPPNSTSSPTTTEKTQFRISVIDLKGIRDDPLRYNETVEHARHASETWGFFQSRQPWDTFKRSRRDETWSSKISRARCGGEESVLRQRYEHGVQVHE